jgi:hypothetical protein
MLKNEFGIFFLFKASPKSVQHVPKRPLYKLSWLLAILFLVSQEVKSEQHKAIKATRYLCVNDMPISTVLNKNLVFDLFFTE